MSAEVSGNFTLQCLQGADVQRLGFTILDDIGVGGRVVYNDYTLVDTVEELIDVEDITAIDFIAVKNISLNVDETKFIEVGPATGVYCSKLFGHATNADRGDGFGGKWNGSAVIYAKPTGTLQILRVYCINVV